MGDLVQLEKIDRQNWEACADLKVCAAQRDLICSNERSLAEAGVLENATALAITLGGAPIGIAVLLIEKDYLEIHRFMIGCSYQRKGHGREALRQILGDVRSRFGEYPVIIKFLHWNSGAELLYRSVGFEDTGTTDGPEKVFSFSWRRFSR